MWNVAIGTSFSPSTSLNYSSSFTKRNNRGVENELEMSFDNGIKTENKDGKVSKLTGKEECQTCKNRKYQDESDDSGVSFQTPTHISPSSAPSAVTSHELEHVYRERAKAEGEQARVVSQRVMLNTSVCPECHRTYVSGGTTTTTTSKKVESLFNVGKEQKKPQFQLSA